MSAEQLTLLTAGMKIGKRIKFRKGKWIKEDRGGFAKTWSVETVNFDTLTGLLHILRTRGRSCTTALIHGAPLPCVDLASTPRNDDLFEAVPRGYAIVDVDDLTVETTDPHECARIARSQLPPAFHAAACVWNASSGHAINPTQARLRLFFLLDRPLLPAQVKAWITQGELKVDESIYGPSKLIYLGVDVDGGYDNHPDPADRRWGSLLGAERVHVPDILPAPVEKEHEKRGKRAPDNVEADQPHMILAALDKLALRSPARVASDGRRNSFRFAATDFSDHAVSAYLAEQMIDTWRDPDLENFEQLYDALDEAGVDIVDAEPLANKLRAIADDAELQDLFTSGEPLDRQHVEKQVEDGYRGRNEFGCEYVSQEDAAERELALAASLAVEGEDDPPPPRKATALLLSGDAARDWTPTKWFVKHLLPTRGICMPFGESHVFKSWLMIDWASRLDRGMPIAGHLTAETGVAMMAGEGVSGLPGRFKAWETYNGLSEGKVLLVGPGYDVFEDGTSRTRDTRAKAQQNLSALFQAYYEQVGKRIRVLIIDTLSSVAPMIDENDPVAVKGAFNIMREMERKLGVLILLVHHTGKDVTKGARGSSIFFANADTQIAISEEGSKHFFEVTKQRDGLKMRKTEFKVDKQVALGVGYDGDVETSCAVYYETIEQRLAVTDGDDAQDLGARPKGSPPPEPALTKKEREALEKQSRTALLREANSVKGRKASIRAAAAVLGREGESFRLPELYDEANAQRAASGVESAMAESSFYATIALMQNDQELRVADDNKHTKRALMRFRLVE